MTASERAAALQQAIEKVMAAAKELDTQKTDCCHCGMSKYVNWTEAQAQTELDAVIGKLFRWKDRFVAKAREEKP